MHTAVRIRIHYTNSKGLPRVLGTQIDTQILSQIYPALSARLHDSELLAGTYS